jgi:uncharacterized protein
MTLTIHESSIPAFVQVLTALSGCIDKADAYCIAHKIDPSVLVQARLYPTMFAFARQVQIACDFAKNTSGRLAGDELPKFADEEKTFDELKARIAKTIAYVQGLKAASFAGSETRDITFPVAGTPMTMKGAAYLFRFALPNFYFHVTTAYAILRENGIDLGKRDFMGNPVG